MYNYCRNNADPKAVYIRMWQHMSNKRTSVMNTQEGVQRVRQGSYAFVTEATTADYWVNQPPCDLVKIPVEIFERKYSFAARIGLDTTIKSKINEVITKLENDGEIEKLKANWFGVGMCSAGSGTVAALGAVLVATAASWMIAVNH